LGGWLSSGGDHVGHAKAPVVTHPKPVVPAVNSRAMTGHGTVAFVSLGALWLFGDGVDGLHQLMPGTRHPQQPTFSADGRWLTVTAGRVGQQVWLARSNGTGLHKLHGPVSLIGWSPQGHVLGLEVRNRTRTAVVVLRPGHAVHVVARINGEYGAAWSPDGRAIAVVSFDYPLGRTAIRTFPVGGEAPTTWFSVPTQKVRFAGMDEIRLQIAGWWRRTGIGFWVYGNGMVGAIDQAPLELVARPGAAPRHLADSLTGYREAAVTAARNGGLAVVAETSKHGFGRLIWQDKRVTVCAPGAHMCGQAPAPRGSVTLDPAWSPNGRHLAYVVAAEISSAGFPQATVTRWYNNHRLMLDNVSTGRAQVVPDSYGATAPRWSDDGRTLFFESHDGLWLLVAGARRPVQVASPLFAPTYWPAYYGQVDWTGQFAWTG
jgi:TolB protein